MRRKQNRLLRPRSRTSAAPSGLLRPIRRPDAAKVVFSRVKPMSFRVTLVSLALFPSHVPQHLPLQWDCGRPPRPGRELMRRTDWMGHGAYLRNYLDMDKFVIRGGNPLLGTIRVSGAKNAALPAMAAALLTEEPLILENIPQVRDIETTRKLLAAMGAEVELGYGRAYHRTTICCRDLASPEASYELVKTMRASTLVLGPLVARCGRARVSLPGGCAIGARPIDLHIKGLERLGATITQEHGYVEASAQHLRGAEIVFDKITVTGTEDLLMAATLADGETVMRNCAREPEVADLADLLNKMGAQ